MRFLSLLRHTAMLSLAYRMTGMRRARARKLRADARLLRAPSRVLDVKCALGLEFLWARAKEYPWLQEALAGERPDRSEAPPSIAIDGA